MLAGLLLAGAFSTQLDLSDRTEIRLRGPGSVSRTASVDLETAVTARLRVASRRALFSLSYVPRFTLWDIDLAAAPALMQDASARAEWHDRFTRWSLEQSGSYGGINLTSLSFVPVEGAMPHVDVVPASRLIQYASSTTTVSERVTLRRWTFDWLLGYQLSGGVDADARAILPMQSGPFAEAKLDYRASRRTHFVTKTTGAEATFSSGPESILVEATEAWRFAWSPSTTTEIALGGAEVRARAAANASSAYTTYPVAEITLEHRWGQPTDRFAIRSIARLAPVVNRVYGTVDERAQATLQGTWTHQRLVLNAFATAQQTVPADNASAVQLVAGELSASYATSATSFWAFDVGVRTMGQRLSTPVSLGSSDYTQTSFVQGIVFFGLSMRAPRVRW
jgi:hypothetical protein